MKVSVILFIDMWSLTAEDMVSGVNRFQDVYNFPKCSQHIKPSNEIITSALASRFLNYLIHFVLLLLSLAVVSRSKSNLPAALSPVVSAETLLHLH